MNAESNGWQKVYFLVGQEAYFLDERLWDEWLGLYTKDCIFWVPAWGDDGRLSEDPHSQISMIYYPSRAGLEDRVFRIRTGASSASTPELRTNHIFSLLKVQEVPEGFKVRTNWLTESFREDQRLSYRGYADYDLVEREEGLRIVSKRTVVLDPVTDTVLDFYMI